MTRLIVTAFVLLVAMTAGAFAASSSAPAPKAADLPAIVTELLPTVAAAPEPTPAPKTAKKKSKAHAAHPAAPAPVDPPKTTTTDPKKDKDLKHSEVKEHEVVTPPLHETDENGHETDRNDHGSGH